MGRMSLNLSKIVNPLDIEFSIDGQLYVAVAVEGRTITFKSNCHTCGEEFTTWTPLHKFQYPSRRCEKHRKPGLWTKTKKPKSTRSGDTGPQPVFVDDLRKLRAAGKTMKQLAKWLLQTHKLEMTASEIWAMVRDVKPATNVINLKDRS